MKMRITLMMMIVGVMAGGVAQASLYSSGFEVSEGFTAGGYFDNNLDQQGWTMVGSSYETVYDGIHNDLEKDNWAGKTGDQFVHFGYNGAANSPTFSTVGYDTVTMTIDLRHPDDGGYYYGGGGTVLLYDSTGSELTSIRFAPNGVGGSAENSYGNIIVTTDGAALDTGIGWSYDGPDEKESLEVVLDQVAKTMSINYNGTSVVTDVAWGAGTGTFNQIGLKGGRAVGYYTSFDEINVIPEPATMSLVAIAGVALMIIRRRITR